MRAHCQQGCIQVYWESHSNQPISFAAALYVVLAPQLSLQAIVTLVTCTVPQTHPAVPCCTTALTIGISHTSSWSLFACIQAHQKKDPFFFLRRGSLSVSLPIKPPLSQSSPWPSPWRPHLQNHTSHWQQLGKTLQGQAWPLPSQGRSHLHCLPPTSPG